MAHNHTHDHGHGDEASKNIVIAFILNLSFAAIELVGGVLTNSVAILSDALHDFGDSVSLGVAWVLQKKSGRKRDGKYSYGYKRFSLLGSVFLSGVLLVSSIFIITEAVRRIFNPQEVHAKGMFWLAVAGLVINGVAVLRLKKGKTLSERAVLIHMMEDVLGWGAVLVVSIVMMFAHVPVLDPVLSLCITAWVLWNVWHNLKATFKILLQGIPENIDTGELTEELLKLKGVKFVHDLHIWSQDGVTHVGTMHVVVSPDVGREGMSLVKKAVRDLCKRYQIDHVTVEMETSGECDCEYAQDDR